MALQRHCRRKDHFAFILLSYKLIISWLPFAERKKAASSQMRKVFYVSTQQSTRHRHRPFQPAKRKNLKKAIKNGRKFLQP